MMASLHQSVLAGDSAPHVIIERKVLQRLIEVLEAQQSIDTLLHHVRPLHGVEGSPLLAMMQQHGYVPHLGKFSSTLASDKLLHDLRGYSLAFTYFSSAENGSFNNEKIADFLSTHSRYRAQYGPYGKTLLYLACCTSTLEVVKFLVETCHCEVDAQNQGPTLPPPAKPIDAAAHRRENWEIFTYLASKGAKPPPDVNPPDQAPHRLSLVVPALTPSLPLIPLTASNESIAEQTLATCSICKREKAKRANFCSYCGASLTQRCVNAQCRKQVKATDRYCGICGAAQPRNQVQEAIQLLRQRDALQDRLAKAAALLHRAFPFISLRDASFMVASSGYAKAAAELEVAAEAANSVAYCSSALAVQASKDAMGALQLSITAPHHGVRLWRPRTMRGFYCLDVGLSSLTKCEVMIGWAIASLPHTEICSFGLSSSGTVIANGSTVHRHLCFGAPCAVRCILSFDTGTVQFQVHRQGKQPESSPWLPLGEHAKSEIFYPMVWVRSQGEGNGYVRCTIAPLAAQVTPM